MFWGHFSCSWRKTDLKWCRKPPKYYLLSLSFPWPRDLESRIFDFGNLRSGQFCDHSIIRQRGKNQIPHLSIRSGNFIKIWVLLCYWSWSSSKFWSVTFIKVIWGRMTSSEVTNRLLLIIHEWKQLQIRAWSHCVSLVKTHRLICNMTYLGQHVASRELDLRSNFELTSQYHQVHVSTRLDERNTMVLEFRR